MPEIDPPPILGLNQYLLRYSLRKWMRFLDLMREDRYAFFSPEKSFEKLESLLPIRTGMPETDRNGKFRQAFVLDRENWTIRRPTYGKWTSSVSPKDGNSWLEKYPEIHGQKTLPAFPAPDTYVSNLIADRKEWGKILRGIVDFYHAYQSLFFQDVTFFKVTGKRWITSQHNGTIPEGDGYNIDSHDRSFGCYQNIMVSSSKPPFVSETYFTRFQIVDFEPPFDVPYHIAVLGKTKDFFQFDGMGFVEFPDAYNVFFEDGPIEGKYTSPMIGPDRMWTTPDLDAFKNNTSKEPSGGWKVEDCILLLVPDVFFFPDETEKTDGSSL